MRSSCHAAKNFSSRFQGSTEDKRRRGTSVSDNTVWIRSANERAGENSFPHEPRLTPVSTASFVPPCTARWISATISAAGRLLARPRATRVMQNVQCWSQPSCALMNALVRKRPPGMGIRAPRSTLISSTCRKLATNWSLV